MDVYKLKCHENIRKHAVTNLGFWFHGNGECPICSSTHFNCTLIADHLAKDFNSVSQSRYYNFKYKIKTNVKISTPFI